MHHVSAQGIDERMINVHYYYYYTYRFKDGAILPNVAAGSDSQPTNQTSTQVTATHTRAQCQCQQQGCLCAQGKRCMLC